jgi:hypothetical protein
LQPTLADPVALSVILPLFYEKAATVSMVKHGMEIQSNITEYLNPGQVLVMAFDQSLYALAKYLQWQFPDIHGEKQFVVMFRGLHIEMALWKAFGKFLDGSGTQGGLQNCLMQI